MRNHGGYSPCQFLWCRLTEIVWRQSLFREIPGVKITVRERLAVATLAAMICIFILFGFARDAYARYLHMGVSEQGGLADTSLMERVCAEQGCDERRAFRVDEIALRRETAARNMRRFMSFCRLDAR